MPRGGKRPGAGRPFGSRDPHSKTKEQLREHLRSVIAPHIEEMALAQVAAAKGFKYLVRRGAKGGKFEVVTQEMVEAGVLADDDTIIEAWVKQPSTQAFTDLANRLMDKPKEQEQDVNVRGNLVVRWQGE